MRVRALAVAFAVLLTVIVGSFIAGEVAQAAPAGTSAAECAPGQDCGTAAGSVSGQPSGSPAPCLQRTVCGGGAVLAFGGIIVFAVLAPTTDLIAGTRSRWTIRFAVRSAIDRLAAGRLFRPPRLSF